MTPNAPPLGRDLYATLRSEYPKTWGSLTSDLADSFSHDFETAMVQVWEKQLDVNSRLIIDMALFFSRFLPPNNKTDCYSRLIWSLQDKNLISQTAFATLNYECVLDVAASRVGLRVAYLDPEPPKWNLLIWKLHGACNLLPVAQVWKLLLVAKSFYEGPIEPITDLGEIKARYDHGYALPPAMSLYAPGKETPVARGFIQQVRDQWSAWVRSSTHVVVVGVRPILEDSHVWDPILQTDAQVLYIGSAGEEYEELGAKLGDRLEYISDRFHKAVGPLARWLRSLCAAEE